MYNVTERLRALRERAGLSMEEVARTCGYRRASSYQYYEDGKLFTRRYIPLELAEKLSIAFIGRGQPPIQEDEVLALAGLKLATDSEWEDLGRQLRNVPIADRETIIASLEAMLRIAKRK